MILRPKSPNRSCRFWGPNRETHRHRFWDQTGINHPNGFEAKPLTNHPNGFETKPLTNRLNGFEAKPLTNRSAWFWGQTKKPTLLVSLCTMQTAHSVIRPLDHLATEYLTYVTIPGPLHLVSYSCRDSCRCPSYRTDHLHTMRQANMILHMNQS
jgi:hypothetical protein